MSSKMNKLAALFQSLEPLSSDAEGTAAFFGCPIGRLPHHLAKDSQGRPVVLLAVGDVKERPPTTSLQNLRVEHDVQCRISRMNGADVVGAFSLVHCLSQDAAVQEYYLQTMESILGLLPQLPSARQVSDAIDRLAVLFLAFQNPPTKTIRGLWSELFIIVHSHDPHTLVHAWRNEMTERFDFGLGHDRLEVKSSADRTRRHHFSYAQVYPAAGVQVVIASIFLEQAANGRSLGSLWDDARTLVGDDPELRLKIDQICVEALGSTWQEARQCSYDEHLAVESLCLFDVSEIPKVGPDHPVEVSDVRFRSDLSRCTPLSRKAGANRLLNAYFGS